MMTHEILDTKLTFDFSLNVWDKVRESKETLATINNLIKEIRERYEFVKIKNRNWKNLIGKTITISIPKYYTKIEIKQMIAEISVLFAMFSNNTTFDISISENKNFYF